MAGEDEREGGKWTAFEDESWEVGHDERIVRSGGVLVLR
jgi:hypothetical protein